MELDSLLKRVVEVRATDVHLKIGRPPIVRRDGDLMPLEGWDAVGDPELASVLKRVTAHAPARLKSFEQAGELDIAYSAPGLPRFRVNGFRQRGAISFAFRLIPAQVPTFKQLSLPEGVRRLSDEQRGLVLVTGATGSGKTTTLSAMLGHVNRTRRQHIVTIEDPDVILIGELRDAETAMTALQAAESGHLVLSTLHTIDAAETLGRLIEFFPGVKQAQVRSIMAGVLKGVLSQRLLPKSDGGRIAALEVMITNARIAELIRESRTDEISDAIEEGEFFHMQTFRRALIELVITGQIDREV